MKKKRGVQRSCDRWKGDGRGGDGRRVANGHMTVGGRGEGQGEGGAGAGPKGGGGGRQGPGGGPGRPATLGPSGLPL